MLKTYTIYSALKQSIPHLKLQLKTIFKPYVVIVHRLFCKFKAESKLQNNTYIIIHHHHELLKLLEQRGLKFQYTSVFCY